VLLGRPYRLEVREKGRIVLRMGDCFRARRCPEKKRYLDALLAQRRATGDDF